MTPNMTLFVAIIAVLTIVAQHKATCEVPMEWSKLSTRDAWLCARDCNHCAPGTGLEFSYCHNTWQERDAQCGSLEFAQPDNRFSFKKYAYGGRKCWCCPPEADAL